MAKNELQNARGNQQTISGKIAKPNKVKRNGEVSHVAIVKGEDGKQTRVDFGSDATGLKLVEDAAVTVTGPMVKAGNQTVLLARKIKIDGKTREIERNGRSYTGTVQSTRMNKMGSNDRRVAKLKTESGKVLTVDMGPAKDAKNVSEGDQITVTGIPARVGNRVLLRANEIR